MDKLIIKNQVKFQKNIIDKILAFFFSTKIHANNKSRKNLKN